MKAPRLFAGMLLALFAVLPAGLGQPPATNEDLKVAVVRTDEARLAAMLHADIAALDDLLTADSLYVHSGGWVQTKPELLAALKSGALRYTVLQYTAPPLVRGYGRDTAVLSGTMQLEARPKDRPVVNVLLLVTVVYVQKDGHWRFASYQSTVAAQ